MKKLFIVLMSVLISTFIIWGSLQAQVIRGQDPTDKIRIIQVDTTGVLYVLTAAGDTVYVEWAKTYSDFPADTITVSTGLDSVTFSPAWQALCIYTPDEDVNFWINDSTEKPGLLEQSAAMRWTGRLFSVTKVYLKKIAAGNSKVYLTGIR